MNSLIIGQGEIGLAVKDFISEFDKVSTYDIKNQKNLRVPTQIDLLHICFPYSDSFVKDVKNYITRYEPLHVIVWSTVPIGTCTKIGNVAHSPVEGKHPSLADSISLMTRWIGVEGVEEQYWFRSYFIPTGLNVKLVNKPEYTEALKLLSTSEYGVNIVFADYKKRVANALDMDYSLMKDWNKDYNELYNHLGYEEYRKYVLDPPHGKIGGHCVVPNAELLDEQFPNDMLKMIKEYK